MKLNSIIALILFVFFLGLTRAEACPVCFQSGGEERWAFYFTTAFLTVLPLSLIGGGVLWLRKRIRQLDKESSGE